MDEEFLDLLRKWLIHWEGWTNWAYLDSANPENPTIGVGFNMNATSPSSVPKKRVE